MNVALHLMAHVSREYLDLDDHLRVIRREALAGMKGADNHYPEVHQALASIVSLTDDAQASLAQADAPIDVREHLEHLDEGTTAMDVDRS